MTPGTLEGAVLERLRATLASWPAVQLAVLFGSATRGQLRPDSDLDLAILPVDLGDPDLDDLTLQSALTLAAGREVDLIRLDQAPTLLKWQVANSALPVLERVPGALARFRAHAASEYADFAPAFEHHAERFRQRLIEEGIKR